MGRPLAPHLGEGENSIAGCEGAHTAALQCVQREWTGRSAPNMALDFQLRVSCCCIFQAGGEA